VETGATGDLVRHRHTKGAATDRVDLKPPASHSDSTNPVYDWEAVRRTGYRWCIERLRALLAHVDAVRLDHFRAFAAAWHVPAGAQTAQSGQWVPGPGAEFFGAVQRELGDLPFIAEDLGLITPDVCTLRDQFRVPGTRVLQFAFDGHPDNPYLPDNYIPNTVVYTGTHDNPTAREWYEELPDAQRRALWSYLKRPEGRGSDAAPALMQLAWSSRAALAIAPLQDVLNLSTEARMNVPGRAEGNWRWRCFSTLTVCRKGRSPGDLEPDRLAGNVNRPSITCWPTTCREFWLLAGRQPTPPTTKVMR